jgi:hypothetical protein
MPACETSVKDGLNPYLFVVGCPRSGTTLLQRMLDHHPRLAVANDTHFIPRAVPGLEPGSDLPLTPDLTERVRTYHRFHRLGVSDDAVEEAAAQSRTYSEFVAALYSSFAAEHGKPLAGEKTPDYVRHLRLLSSLFPWAKTVHIVRDGRDVALSLLEWAREDRGPGRFALWREEPIAVSALWWSWLVSAGRLDGGTLGPRRYHELRYEDLVAHPEQRLRVLAAFIELPYAPEMARYFEGKTRPRPGRSAKSAWLPPTSGLRNWRTQMSVRDQELFEAIAGRLLSELGYERARKTVGPEVAAVAERCEGWWRTEMQRRREKEARHRRPSRVVPQRS